MAPDFIGEMVYCMLIIGMFSLVLGFGEVLADYVLPHFPRLEAALWRMFGFDTNDFENEEEGGEQ